MSAIFVSRCEHISQRVHYYEQPLAMSESALTALAQLKLAPFGAAHSRVPAEIGTPDRKAASLSISRILCGPLAS